MPKLSRSLAAAVVVLILAGVALAWLLALRKPELPEGLIKTSGRIEGDRILVAGKFDGKVAVLHSRESTRVIPGQIMVELDDVQARARVSQAREQEAAARAEYAAEAANLEVLRKDVPLEVERAEKAVAQADSAVRSARARSEQTGRDASRFAELSASGSVARQTAEQAALEHTVARSELVTALAARERTDKELAQARLGYERIEAQARQVEAAGARLAVARAALVEQLSVLDDLTIRAPVNGTVITRQADVGEVIKAGSPLFELADLDRLYLKAYVAENLIGKLRLGLPARVYTDAFPERPFPAHVGEIASQAEFTPKEVQTPDERTKLVFAVKLYLDENPDHALNPGMPADAVIRWQDDAPWVKPEW